MEKPVYHATLKKMQESGVSPQYAHGWATGVLDNTPLEEQRVTEAYTAGYEDGQNAVLDGYASWIEN
ncbi:hypothetical protein AB833_18150 [Chromatiales bacterium (ex Bugula neritina AB1)]|nr:hypothetical protein AB833_18150 [Chromatiales bacterium (ex Bugula neritina AB1)]